MALTSSLRERPDRPLRAVVGRTPDTGTSASENSKRPICGSIDSERAEAAESSASEVPV